MYARLYLSQCSIGFLPFNLQHTFTVKHVMRESPWVLLSCLWSKWKFCYLYKTRAHNHCHHNTNATTRSWVLTQFPFTRSERKNIAKWLKGKYFFSCLVSFFCLLGDTVGCGSARCIDRRRKQNHTYLPLPIHLVNLKYFCCASILVHFC